MVSVPSELAEEYARINLSSYEWRIVWFVLSQDRFRKPVAVTYGDIAQATGIDQRNVERSLKQLRCLGIIGRTGNGRYCDYHLQYYNDWKIPDYLPTAYHHWVDAGCWRRIWKRPCDLALTSITKSKRKREGCVVGDLVHEETVEAA
jgi:hypothetical protein